MIKLVVLDMIELVVLDTIEQVPNKPLAADNEI